MKVLPLAILSLAMPQQAVALAQSCSDLIALPVLPGFDVSSAAAITCDGQTVAGTSTDSGLTRFGAFRWSETQGIMGLGALGGIESNATDVSCDGGVIVGSAETASNERHPFRWTEAGGMEDLFAQAGVSGNGVASAVSEDGLTIVGTELFGIEHAFVWTQATGIQQLPGLATSSSGARDVSQNGQFVVGWSRNANNELRAVRWTVGGGALDLGTLGGGRSEAFAVSADGQVIVGLARNAAGLDLGFRWTQSTGMVLLDGSLPTFSYGLAVNRDGSVIGGGDPTGDPGAFLWTPDGGAQAPLLPDSLTTKAMTPNGSTLLIIGSEPNTAGSLVLTSYLLRTTPLGTKFCGTAVPNSTGCSGYISAFGSAFVPADQLNLSATRLPPNTFGFFLTSQTTSGPATVSGSQGILCLAGSIGRFVGPGQVKSSGAAGQMDLSVGLSSLPTPTGLVTGVAGETWSFQCWHRDANPSATSNFTDAISVVLR